MHFYKFNIGDYASHTRHLSLIEDAIYRRLLDLAYTTEQPILNDIREISRKINAREYQQEIQDVLNEFFVLVQDGWVNNRVLKEIEDVGVKSEKARLSALQRWAHIKQGRADKSQCDENANAHLEDANASSDDAKAIKSDATQDPLPETRDPLHTNQEKIDLFEALWKIYPRKKNKGDAKKAWKKIKSPVETLELIKHALNWQTKSIEWTKEGGQYIPYPSSYLNSEGWLDEPVKSCADQIASHLIASQERC